MKSLRIQLMLSHMALVVLMVCVMAGAVASFFRLGHSIDHILRNNYDSVIAAQNMKEALERQDSAATFYLAGQTGKARDQYRQNWPVFRTWADVEAHNITEPGEQQISDDIQRQFPEYRKSLERLLYGSSPADSAGNRRTYFRDLEPRFLRLKQRAQDVLDLNQAAIIRANGQAKAEARSATERAVAAAVLVLIVAVALAVRSTEAIVKPLRTFARQAKEIGAGNLDLQVDVCRTDELGALAGSFNEMVKNLRFARGIEAERLHRAERMSDAALENLYDPVIVTDASGRIVHMNRAAEGLYGPAASAVGKNVAAALKEPRIAEAVERAIHNEDVSASEGDAAFVNVNVGADQRTYRLRATPMRDDTALLGSVAVLEDVTHLRELDRLKTEFIGVASHELRTPVTSLLLSAQILEEGVVGDLTPEQATVVAAQREDLERLDRMMRELLDMARLEAGSLPPRFAIVPPARLVQHAVDAVAPQARAKGVSLAVRLAEGIPDLKADEAQMTRALVNLLNNAIRHTPSGGEVIVIASADTGSVRIAVEDTGTGIPAAYLPRVFDRFVQAPGATGGGSGLGLSIVKSIVTAHRGEVAASARVGGGMRFVISLPRAAQAERKVSRNGKNPVDRRRSQYPHDDTTDA